jgi:hypothetical protein
MSTDLQCKGCSVGSFLTLADGTEAVLQFRTDPLDLGAFKIARGSLGSTVPDARALEHHELLKERVWACFLTRLHGKMWDDGVARKGALRPDLLKDKKVN